MWPLKPSTTRGQNIMSQILYSFLSIMQAGLYTEQRPALECAVSSFAGKMVTK